MWSSHSAVAGAGTVSTSIGVPSGPSVSIYTAGTGACPLTGAYPSLYRDGLYRIKMGAASTPRDLRVVGAPLVAPSGPPLAELTFDLLKVLGQINRELDRRTYEYLG